MANVKLTHHAIERKWQRRVSTGMIKQAVNDPDGKKHESDGDTQFYKTIRGRKVHVVARPKRGDGWLIKTVWVDGEDDPNIIWKVAVTFGVNIFFRWF